MWSAELSECLTWCGVGMPASEFKHVKSYCCLLEVLHKPEKLRLCEGSQCLTHFWGANAMKCLVSLHYLIKWAHLACRLCSAAVANPHSMSPEEEFLHSLLWRSDSKEIIIFVQLIFVKSSADVKSHGFCCDAAVTTLLVYEWKPEAFHPFLPSQCVLMFWSFSQAAFFSGFLHCEENFTVHFQCPGRSICTSLGPWFCKSPLPLSEQSSLLVPQASRAFLHSVWLCSALQNPFSLKSCSIAFGKAQFPPPPPRRCPLPERSCIVLCHLLKGT